MSRQAARETLRTLINERNVPGADLATIDARIWKIFGERRAILVTDMTGFTLRTDKFGITHFLSLIHRMRQLAEPVILEHNGFLLKAEADNLFILFRDMPSALFCARALHNAAASYNLDRDTDEQIRFCAGVGFGDILLIGDDDAWGAEINRAFKLGEDTAKSGETLLTPDAHEATCAELPGLRFVEMKTEGAGLMPRHFALDCDSLRVSPLKDASHREE
jgi:adenylate cyclase